MRAERQRLAALAATLVELRDRLATAEAPVACETLSICFWAGRPSIVDLWKLRHERTLASLDTPRLLEAIAGGRFGAVVTFGNFSGPQQDENLPGLWAPLAEGYAPPIYYGTAATLFLPKSPAAD